MGEPYFIWKGIDSRNMRVWVQRMPPITRPPVRYQSVTIPGRPGALTLLEGEDVYEAYVREMTIMPKPNADLSAIINWLTGSGEVVFSIEAERSQKARIYDEVSLTRQFANQRSAVVRFLCDPFKQSRFEQKDYPMTVDAEAEGSYTLTNKGDVIAHPMFRLTATGAVGITVNGTQIALRELDEDTNAVIDCETREAYRTVTDENTGVESIYPLVTNGDYPILDHEGASVIEWSTGISELHVFPRWRWL